MTTRPRSGKGRNSAERAPTTTGAAPAATSRQVVRRVRLDRSECQTAGATPKRRSKRASHCEDRAISGSRTSACRATAQCLGDGFEIDFGLAGAGDAIEQERRKAAIPNRLRERVCGFGLRGFQRRRREIRVGDRRCGDAGRYRGQRAGLYQPANDRFRYAGDAGEVADTALPVGEAFQRLRAFGRKPGGRCACKPIFGDLAIAEEGHRGPDHADDTRQWRKVIVRHPFAQAAQRRGDGGNVDARADGTQAFRDRPRGPAAARHPRQTPVMVRRAERHTDSVAGGEREARRHGIVERAQPVLEDDDADGLGGGHVTRLDRISSRVYHRTAHAELVEAPARAATGFDRLSLSGWERAWGLSLHPSRLLVIDAELFQI